LPSVVGEVGIREITFRLDAREREQGAHFTHEFDKDCFLEKRSFSGEDHLPSPQF